MPARERIAVLVDPDSFVESSSELVSIDPLLFHDRLPVADRLAEAREQPAVAEAVVTGSARIGGVPISLIALDLAVFGTGIGIVAGEKIALGLEQALTSRTPVIAICSGSTRGQDGVLAVAQSAKLASIASRMRRAGVPLITVLTHPTTGNVLTGLASQGDLVFAEPGAQIGPLPASAEGATARSTDALFESGAIDGIVARDEQRARLTALLDFITRRSAQHALDKTTDESHATTVIQRLMPGAVELRPPDADLDVALGRISGTAAIAIGFGGGFGSSSLDSLARFYRLAAHLELPLVLLVTSGPASQDDDALIAQGAAHVLSLQAAIPVPIVAVALGPISGVAGSLCMATDRAFMLEHATFVQGSGESVATARECLRLGLIEQVIALPAGSQADPDVLASAIETPVRGALDELVGISERRLLDQRAIRLRHLGAGTAEGLEAARNEWRELQEVQRTIARSIGEFRERWTQRGPLNVRLNLPHFQPRPGSHAITVPKLNFRRPDFTEFGNRVAATRRGLVSRLQVEAQPEENGNDE
jgi:acetyl-CoA carboxylase carboxyl transferase subunit beta